MFQKKFLLSILLLTANQQIFSKAPLIKAAVTSTIVTLAISCPEKIENFMNYLAGKFDLTNKANNARQEFIKLKKELSAAINSKELEENKDLEADNKDQAGKETRV